MQIFTFIHYFSNYRFTSDSSLLCLFVLIYSLSNYRSALARHGQLKRDILISHAIRSDLARQIASRGDVFNASRGVAKLGQ